MLCFITLDFFDLEIFLDLNAIIKIEFWMLIDNFGGGESSSSIRLWFIGLFIVGSFGLIFDDEVQPIFKVVVGFKYLLYKELFV